jgi:phospholipid/cholesterol/gamma-HCH transport system substrate-binding protein
MGKKDILKKFFAGLFFIGCVLMIAGVVFLIGIEKGLTEPRFTISVLYSKVGGLANGAPVRLSGVTVGTVESIDFLEHEIDGRGVKVGLRLYERYRKQVQKSIEIAIITEGVLGEKVVEITTDPKAYLPDFAHAIIIGKDPLDVQNLAETLGATAKSLQVTSQQIGDMTNQMSDIFLTTRRLLNRVEQRIIEGNLFKIF